MKVLIAVLFVFLVACSESGSGSAAGSSGQTSPDPGAFDDLTRTLDRAEVVEDTLRESAEARRRQLEAAE